MQWILEDFWKSVFEPGVNKGLLVVMHAAFIGLMLTLLFLLVLTNFVNPHIWVLLISSLGLYLSILWFINEAYGQKSASKPVESRKKKPSKSSKSK